MSGIQRSETEKNNRNRYIEAMGQKLTADTARKIDGQLATNLNNSLNTTMQDVDSSVDRMLWEINRNQQIDANEQFAADEARRASRQQGVVDRANGLSASLLSQASALENRHRNQIAGIQASADAAFAKGVARGEYAYEQGYAARMAMPGRVNFDLDAALAGNKAMWGEGIARSNNLLESFHSLNNSWSGFEKNQPVLAQAFSRQATPQTVTGVVIDATSGLTGSLRTQVKIGNVSYSEPYKGVRFTQVYNPNPSPTVPALGPQGAKPWNASTAMKLAHGLGEFSQSAKVGGAIGAVMAPAGTILQYSMDGKSMASTEFAGDMAYNTGKGVISGYVAGAAGVAATALVVATAPAWVAVAVGVTAGVGVGIAVSEGIDYAAKGIRSGLDSFIGYGVENWGW